MEEKKVLHLLVVTVVILSMMTVLSFSYFFFTVTFVCLLAISRMLRGFQILFRPSLRIFALCFLV